jgi:hypothetical protein
VTASGGLVEIGFIAHGLQLPSRLRAMTGMEAIIAPARCKIRMGG